MDTLDCFPMYQIGVKELRYMIIKDILRCNQQRLFSLYILRI